MAQRLSNDDIGTLQVFKGSAVVIRDNQPRTGQTGTPIDNKDHIKAAASSIVALILKDTTIIRLEAGSEVEVTAVTYQNGKLKDAEFSLVSGRMWARVQPLASGANFNVETPTVTAAVRGTSFNTTFKNHITGIYVYHHIVEVTLNSNGENTNVNRTQLLQMKQNSLKNDFDKGPSPAPNSFYDAWIKFNMQQDDLLCQQRHDIPGDCSEPTGIPVPPTVIKNSPPQVAAENTTAPEDTTPRVSSPITTPKITSPITTPTPQPVTLSKVIVSCAYTDFSYPHRNPVPCSAQAIYSDGKQVDVTGTAQWSDSPAVGTFKFSRSYMYYHGSYVTRDHLVTVKATYGGKTGSVVIDTVGLG